MFSPNFKINNKVVSHLNKISEIKALIDSSRILPKQEIVLKRKAAIRMAQSSTSIEGNLLNQNEVSRVFRGEKIFAPRKDELEIRNYQLAQNYIAEALTRREPITVQFILKLHSILMTGLLPPEKIGHFRPGPVYIVNVNVKPKKDELVFRPPKAKTVPRHIDDLLVWLSKTTSEGLSTIIQAAIFHYEFVTIHPFSDGNGRITRLLTTYFLYLKGYEMKKIYVLDSYYNQDRKKYYTALDTGKDYNQRFGVDLTPWIEYFLEGFISELNKIREQLDILKFQSKEKGDVFLSQDEVRLVDFVSHMGRITSADVVDVLKISKRGAQMKLKRLVDIGILSAQGSGPSSFYTPKNRG